ncbi:MAG: pectinesterase family protein [Lachnospiraceae bacterium]|nr:pectinesterase family protein [Lachnospiraceae bacterium]
MRVIYVGEGGFPTISEALTFIEKIRANAAAEGCREKPSREQRDGMLQANAAAEGCHEKSAGRQRDGMLRANAAAPVEIRIAPDVYHEHLEVLQPFVTLCGAGPEETVITGSFGAFEILEDGLKRGTFRTQTAFVHTHDVTMRNLTIENTAGPGHIAGQAIALYADGDRLIFENVHLKGFQDTLFTGPLPPKEVEPGGFRGPLQFAPRINGRQYYRNCRIEGSVDFIFGSATAYFEGCTLVSLDEYAGAASSPQIRGYVTAPSTPEGQEYGYVFAGCVFVGDCPEESCYLGRPWREYAKAVLINCRIGRHIRPEGWHDWGKARAHDTAYFAEYGNCYEGRCRDMPEGLRRHLKKEMLPLYEKERVLQPVR